MKNRLCGGGPSPLFEGDDIHFVATEYLTKWAQTKAVKTDTAAHAATFMYENIIIDFGVPKILVSDKGTHFLNDLISEMTQRFKIDHSLSPSN